MPILRRNSTLRKNYKKIEKEGLASINASDINIPDQHGNTMLHIATKKGNIKLVNYLIDLGGDAQILNNKGQTALDIANRKILQNNKMHNEYSNIAQLLVDYNDFNNNLPSKPQEFNTQTTTIAINHITNTHYVAHHTNKNEIKEKVLSSVEKIQQLAKSPNVSKSKIEAALKLCSNAEDLILPPTQDGLAEMLKITSTNAINLGIIKKAVNDTTQNVQRWLSDQQNHETTSLDNQVSGLTKIKPPVPPKPKKCTDQGLLLPKPLTDSTASSTSEEQSPHNVALNELDALLAFCNDFLSDNNVDLTGLDAS